MLGDSRVTHRSTTDSDEQEPLREQPALYDEINWAPCSLGRCCSFLMVPFVLGLIGLTWVPYVQVFSDGNFSSVVCLIVFHVLLTLLLLSYFQAVFTDPGTVPPAWHSKVASMPNPAYKRCKYTQLYRPLRSHYCNITRRPVLNLDHFCPWVANAVGFKNRKFFILFCFYGMLCSAFASATMGPYALRVSSRKSQDVAMNRALALMAFIIDTTFAIALLLFSVGHLYMASQNTTSLEGSAESRRYNLGWKNNLRTVLGWDTRFWFVPLHRSPLLGDGVHWQLSNATWDGYATKGNPDKA